MCASVAVIPAKAEIHPDSAMKAGTANWVPAFARPTVVSA
jgi:hypothetical protein